MVRELKDKGGPTSGASRTFTARNLFISAQVALSLVALVGAGLFVRSLQNAQRISPGFDADHLAVLTFDVGAQGYGEGQGREFQRQMLERVSAIPGVTSAALSANVPLFQGGFSRSVFLEGQDASDARNGRLVPISIVTDRYFDTIGLSLRSGRGFVETDLPNTPRVVIINETMAKLYWPGEEAVGKRFRFFGQDLSTVIGVARDSKYFGVGEDPLPFVYQPASQVYQPNMALIVRSDRPDAVVGLMRGEVQQMAPRMPLTTVMTYPEIFKQSLWAPRMAASLLGVLGTLSLVLAVIGIYGVMAYSVSQRTRELGLRMALGADRQAVLWLVVSQGLRLAALGLAVGLAVSLGATRLLVRLLYGVSPTDVMTLILVPVILITATLAASYIPARRATLVDPMLALRCE